ncbi:helix-turn-helix transcriptional regulator [Paenibacillus sp. FJAT-26967]|uniref:helix-turn-helix transcriptional regulator n=1 Tax=Paenibacillus sp. FJAT-26967 TaxID=1729690 RepID=UPI0008380DE9|nr:helix-turn-helix transcriptional regulator [Paenibacillus sp. FJAT-26967]
MALRIERSRLPILLAQAGMTQAQLARRLKLSDSFIHKVIKGERQLSLTKSKEAAIIFDCSIDDLYEWVDEAGKRW